MLTVYNDLGDLSISELKYQFILWATIKMDIATLAAFFIKNYLIR